MEGSLQTREWTDRDGNKRYTTEINAQRFQMLGSPRGERDAQPVGVSAQSSGVSTQDAPAEGQGGYEEDDIPF